MTRNSHTRRFATLVRGLIRRTHGQDLIEYAILASIATAVGVLLLAVGPAGALAVGPVAAALVAAAPAVAAEGAETSPA